MENVVAQRIKTVLGSNQISIAAFAKMIGMQQVTCNRQIRGDQAVSIGLIEGFLREFPKISAEWLLRGNGSMVINAQSKPLYKNDLPSESIWQAKYDELEKRYGQLLAVLGGDINRQ